MTLYEKACLAVCILIIGIVFASTARAEDCTRDGQFSKVTCYGVQHGLIAAAVVGAMTAADPYLALPVGIGTCAVFFAREATSVSGAFGSADDIFDWVTPCAVSGFIIWKWGDQSWIPMFMEDGMGAFYKHEFD